MRPTIKSQAIEQMLTKLTGSDRRESIENGTCRPAPMGCGRDVTPPYEFQNVLSVKEHRISGLCQECQDKVFESAEKDDPQCLKGTGVVCNCWECDG